ncbi:MAG: spore coat protein U domain-containing protein [Steroidobacteraceae bacterium]|jgi:spore coat protein U-like protein
MKLPPAAMFLAARIAIGAGIALGLLVAPVARAAVTVNCTVSAGGIAFGVYNPLSTIGDASTGTLLVTCTGSGTGSTSITVDVSLSTGISGNYTTRTMVSGANVLNYNIYWSAADQQIMGNGTGGSYGGQAGPLTITAGGSVQANGTMYGYAPPLQDVAPGGYADVITVTVTY